MSRKLHSSLLLLFAWLAASAQCPTGDLTITTQADLDQFALDYPGCTNLPGSLYMFVNDEGGNPVMLDITDLSPLSNLETIGGDFDIGYAAGMTSLDGLDNLQSVGGYFSLYYMDSLSDLTALENLTTIGSHAIFYYNSAQADFAGLENLESIGGYLQVQYNYALEDFTGLSSLETIGISLSATDNAIASMDGLSALRLIGDQLYLENNWNLASLTALSALTDLAYKVDINNCPALTSLSGLHNLDLDSSNEVEITNCPTLTTCAINSICALILNDGVLTLSGNGTGCNSEAEIQPSCPTCPFSTTWNGTQWSFGLPNRAKITTVEDDFIVGTDLGACTLTINNGAAVTVEQGFNLTVTGDLAVDTGNGALLIVENGANLVQVDAAAVNTGDVRIERSVDLNRLDYVYWGSPVTGQNLRSFSPATLEPRFYVLNPAANAYDAVFETGGTLDEDPATYEFVPGTGYMVRAPDDFPNVPNPKQGFDGAFVGTPSNGNVTVTTTNGASVYHLLANPYPSTINADNADGGFLDANAGTLYFWTHTDQVSGIDNYALYNNSGGTASIAGGEAPNGTIQIGQGFIFDNTANLASVTFDNAMRVGNNDNQFFRSSNQKNRIWLNLSREAVPAGQMMVAYIDGTSTGFDLGYDGKLLTAGTSLSSVTGGVRYGIQARGGFDFQDVVPLSLNATTEGNYTVSIDHVDGLFSAGQDIFLKDNLTGVLHDLKQGDYTFSSVAGTFDERLQLRFAPALGIEIPGIADNAVTVYPENNVLTVSSSLETIKGVRVYDVRGRLLFESASVPGQKVALAGLVAQHQLLLVQVMLGDGTSLIRKTAF